ncbi:unnamed protein product [Merluccius merluccius]
MLRRELMRMVRQNGDLSLLDVRREAIRWVEEGQPTKENMALDYFRAPLYEQLFQCGDVPFATVKELKQWIRTVAQKGVQAHHGQHHHLPPVYAAALDALLGFIPTPIACHMELEVESLTQWGESGGC